MSIPVTHILSHFGQAFPFCTMSAEKFYEQVETTLKKHEFPDIKYQRVKNKEGGMLSSSRLYLRIRHKNLVYEICGIQFGKDFCISSWLYETQTGMLQFLKYTKVGQFLMRRAQMRTFYQADQEAMFKYCVHNSLLEAIDAMTDTLGLRRMSEAQRQMSSNVTV